MSQNLPELPLSAHLLAPIQCICRYPLHLAELVKHTNNDSHSNTADDDNDAAMQVDDPQPAPPTRLPDTKAALQQALESMRHVTEMVNEGKRHSEYLGRVQARFDSFTGPALSAHSTRLFLQTDAIRMTPNLWNNTYTLFLFDRQLIYCKKDLLKRTTYTYKGRIALDTCRILNLPDGKMFGLTLKNALRMHCDRRGKWFDFCFRSASSKLRFLNTLAAERKFSGRTLFVAELTSGGVGGGADHADAVEYVPVQQRSMDFEEAACGGGERPVDVESTLSSMPSTMSNGMAADESQQQQLQQRGNTLPKKSRKTAAHTNGKDASTSEMGASEYNSSSLGRKRIGAWFRTKAKSTNTTPSHSPTHSASMPAAVVQQSEAPDETTC